MAAEVMKMSEFLKTPSLEKNVKRIVRALETKGFKNIHTQFWDTGLDSGRTRIYADFNRDLSITMWAGGEGDNIAYGAQVYEGPGDFPSVEWAPLRSGVPEKIISAFFERFKEQQK